MATDNTLQQSQNVNNENIDVSQNNTEEREQKSETLLPAPSCFNFITSPLLSYMFPKFGGTLSFPSQGLILALDDTLPPKDLDIEGWFSVEKNKEGTLLISRVNGDDTDALGATEHFSDLLLDDWEVISESNTRSIILSSDESAKRRLDDSSRARCLVYGITAGLTSASLFAAGGSMAFALVAAPIGNLFLLNAADFIKLGMKGRTSKIDLENKAELDIIKEVLGKNCKISLVSTSTTAVVKSTLSSINYFNTALTIFAILPEDATPVVNLSENIIQGVTAAASSISARIVEDNIKSKQKPPKENKKVWKRVAGTISAGVKGAGSALLGPFASSWVTK